jgi:hypothetical protein
MEMGLIVSLKRLVIPLARVVVVKIKKAPVKTRAGTQYPKSWIRIFDSMRHTTA